MRRNPFDDSKRVWKRYDPEPSEPEKGGCDQCVWRQWEICVWMITAVIAIAIIANVLGAAGR